MLRAEALLRDQAYRESTVFFFIPFRFVFRNTWGIKRVIGHRQQFGRLPSRSVGMQALRSDMAQQEQNQVPLDSNTANVCAKMQDITGYSTVQIVQYSTVQCCVVCSGFRMFVVYLLRKKESPIIYDGLFSVNKGKGWRFHFSATLFIRPIENADLSTNCCPYFDIFYFKHYCKNYNYRLELYREIAVGTTDCVPTSSRVI